MIAMAGAMVDCWQLCTISMWVDKNDKEAVVRLISDNFTFEDLWQGAVELNKLMTERNLDNRVPKNRDQGDLKDRVKVLGTAILSCLDDLKKS